jgi:RNA-directed DNA polymerase
MTRSSPFSPAANLASAFLAGPWNESELGQRGRRACPNGAAVIRKCVRHVVKRFGLEQAPSHSALHDFLVDNPAIAPLIRGLATGEMFWRPDQMSPAGPAAEWNLPPLTTETSLAEWLNVPVDELDWLADIRGWTVGHESTKLRHYVCRWQARRRGRFRVIESPKPKLKAIQRRILHELLDRIPVHAAAHGFRPDRSVLTYAQPHSGKPIVMRFDLRDFFPSIPASRVHAVFRTAGYPETVARLLTGVCTTRLAAESWEQRPNPSREDMRLGNRLLARHLPQGAPTSPALANLCAFGLDVRLQALADSMQATYTRYADDLAFSGGEELERAARRFQVTVGVIAVEEGFELHFRKSRFMRQGVCQQLAGIVVNAKPNLRRGAYDELKAILTNCVRLGPQSQNREGHPDFRAYLMGRIAFVRMVHPVRGVKLQAMFERIRW